MNNDTPKDIINRLNRIEGQIKGIKKMIEEGRSCSEILVQFSAVRTALKKANNIAIKKFCTECLENMSSINSEEKIQKIVEFIENIE